MRDSPNPRLQLSLASSLSAVVLLSLFCMPLFIFISTAADLIFGECYLCYQLSYGLSAEISQLFWVGFVAALPYSLTAALVATLISYITWRFLPAPSFFAQILAIVLSVAVSFSLFFEDFLVISVLCAVAWILQWMCFGIMVRRI